jgi:hypothetical protein
MVTGQPGKVQQQPQNVSPVQEVCGVSLEIWQMILLSSQLWPITEQQELHGLSAGCKLTIQVYLLLTTETATTAIFA